MNSNEPISAREVGEGHPVRRYSGASGSGRIDVFLSGIGLVAVIALLGCVAPAEFQKLEKEVWQLKNARPAGGADPREQLADANADVDRLTQEIREVSGRLEEIEQKAQAALVEARKARMELASLNAGGAAAGAAAGAQAGAAIVEDDGLGEGEEFEGSAEEIAAYRSAYQAWRGDDHAVCIDRFRKFLQTYPSSPYADDSAFWMADCHYKQGDFKNAVLRFDDVVRNYPSGNKAADALFRQGESLLKLGPGFHEAAKRAFERVLKEYPDSDRAVQARRQLEMLATG